MIRFGVALDLAACGDRTYADRLVVLDPLLDALESLRYCSVSAGESYVFSRNDTMGFHSPNALMMLAALSSRVPTVRLLAGVSLLAGWDARRLAYDATLLDQISGGRVTLGLGLGSPAAWRVFGVSPNGLGPRLEQTVRLLRSAWQGSYSCPEGRVDMVPVPVQPGGPPLLLGGARKVSAQRAAALGDGFVASSGYSHGLIGRQIEHYRAAIEPGRMGRVSVNRFTVVTDSQREATRLYREHVAPLVAAYVGTGLVGDVDGDEEAVLDQLCLVGTPARVAEQVERYRAIGVTDIHLRVRPGTLPVSAAIEGLGLFAEAVRPQFPDTGGALA